METYHTFKVFNEISVLMTHDNIEKRVIHLVWKFASLILVLSTKNGVKGLDFSNVFKNV